MLAGVKGGGEGMPVNSCTMARKLVVSVVRTVVGARLEARGLFLELLDVVGGGGGGAMELLGGGACRKWKEGRGS